MKKAEGLKTLLPLRWFDVLSDGFYSATIHIVTDTADKTREAISSPKAMPHSLSRLNRNANGAHSVDNVSPTIAVGIETIRSWDIFIVRDTVISPDAASTVKHADIIRDNIGIILLISEL